MLDVSHFDIRKEKNKLTKLLSGTEEVALDDACDALARVMLVQALEKEAGNIAAAARRLGVSRTSFYRLLHKHGMRQ